MGCKHAVDFAPACDNTSVNIILYIYINTMTTIFQCSNVQTVVIYKYKYRIYSFSQRLNIQYNV
jgi:hypothetical protein